MTTERVLTRDALVEPAGAKDSMGLLGELTRIVVAPVRQRTAGALVWGNEQDGELLETVLTRDNKIRNGPQEETSEKQQTLKPRWRPCFTSGPIQSMQCIPSELT